MQPKGVAIHDSLVFQYCHSTVKTPRRLSGRRHRRGSPRRDGVKHVHPLREGHFGGIWVWRIGENWDLELEIKSAKEKPSEYQVMI